MLAFLGLVVQEFVHLPGDLYSEPNAIKAFYQVRHHPTTPTDMLLPERRAAHPAFAQHTEQRSVRVCELVTVG